MRLNVRCLRAASVKRFPDFLAAARCLLGMSVAKRCYGDDRRKGFDHADDDDGLVWLHLSYLGGSQSPGSQATGLLTRSVMRQR